VEGHTTVSTAITILELLVCVFVVAVERVHAHQCSGTNHTSHSLIIVIVSASHWIIVATRWRLAAVEVVAKTSNSLAREDAKYISLMLGEFC
jgi:hypothetical protein